MTLKVPSSTGRLHGLLAGKASMEISVATGAVPDFLLKANEYVCAGRVGEALALFDDTNKQVLEDLIERNPTWTDVMYIAAKLLFDLGQTTDAETWYRRIVAQEPHPCVFYDLARLCTDRKQYPDALKYVQRARLLDENNVDYCVAEGSLLALNGQVEAGLKHLQVAAERVPNDRTVQEIHAWHKLYCTGYTRADMQRDLSRVGALYGQPERGCYDFDRVPDPKRCLRVGVLSPDFRQGSVARSFGAFLMAYDRDQYEVWGYGSVANPDAMTSELAARCFRFMNVSTLDDQALSDQLLEDELDILIVLGGYCQDHRLAAVTPRVAPIQVDYGSITTTGIAALDYRLADPILDPPETLSYYSETSVYLPGGLTSLVPLKQSPLVGPLPCLTNGFMTFGSFNNHLKVTAAMISTWAQILRRLPRARLIMKCGAADDVTLKEQYLSQFQSLGVDPQRIHMVGWIKEVDYLALMNQVDLALDVFPYNGCISTMEGLWMGVPLVTLSGATYLSRVGRAIMERVGLGVFVAHSESEYVEKAVAFAAQPKELSIIRKELRSLFLASPMCRPDRFAREIEMAFRQMWQSWCDGYTSSGVL